MLSSRILSRPSHTNWQHLPCPHHTSSDCERLTGWGVPSQKIDGEYERLSFILTTNLRFADWVQVFGDERLTAALLDRLTYHAQIIEL